MKIGIVGAGMAGLSCADTLLEQGHTVRLFDKGRGAGGRMSTKRLDTPLGEAQFDHGAQYFTARDPAFQAIISRLQGEGVAERWPQSGKDAWVGVPGMSSIIKVMSQRHDVAFGRLIRNLVRNDTGWRVVSDQGSDGPFDQIVLAVPAEQAAPFLALHDFGLASVALHARSQPCWTAMLAFDRVLDVEDDVIIDMGPIAWAARNTSKPGRTGPEAWVVQATAQWSATNLELSNEAVLPKLVAAFQQAVPTALPALIASVAHRWRFALSAGLGNAPLWNGQLGLGACGDWVLGPRVECAWLSGKQLADAMCVQSQAVRALV
jgi:renalase